MLSVELSINICISWLSFFTDPLDMFSIFPFTVSWGSISFSLITQAMLLFILEAAIIFLSVSPCFDAKTVLLVICELSNVFVSIDVVTCALAMSLAFNPFSGVSVLACSYFSTLTVLHPFTIVEHCLSMILSTFGKFFRSIFWDISKVFHYFYFFKAAYIAFICLKCSVAKFSFNNFNCTFNFLKITFCTSENFFSNIFSGICAHARISHYFIFMNLWNFLKYISYYNKIIWII